ncbi:MAG: hypothetical protein K2K70_05915 [Lachnospiraceae bacterium]|nr:hypothetical protein [Lachnospiraceae bacterium]
MNIKFIDTSVMLNLLEVPNRCADAEEVKEQWKKNLAAKDVLIMPIATIIETGNHIAHIANGNKRRKIAGKFSEYLRKTAEGEAPWQLYDVKNREEELLYLAENIEDFATREIGIGDMSIIYAYQHYIEETPAIGTIMIWSTDKHLQIYQKDNVSMVRRRRR